MSISGIMIFKLIHKKQALLCSLVFLLLPVLFAIFSPVVRGDAIGRFDIDVDIEELPLEVTVPYENSTSIPFIVKVEGKGNYVGTMNVNLDCSCSHGCVMIEEESISISHGETKRVEGAFSQENLVENETITITVSAEIATEGNVGPGSGTIKTDQGITQIVVLPEKDDSESGKIVYLTIDRILILVIIAFFIFFSSAVGGLIPFLGQWDKESLAKFTVFGGGVILSLCLLNILPGSIAIGGGFAAVGFLVGIPFLFGIEHLLRVPKGEDMGVASLVIGFNLHEIIEGILLSLAVLILTGTGTLAVWALVAISLHSMPASFSYVSYIRLKNISEKLTLTYFIVYLISLPLGIVIGIVILRIIPLALISFIFGLTGGMLLTLSITEMSPASWRKRDFSSPTTFYFIAGAAVMGALLMFL